MDSLDRGFSQFLHTASSYVPDSSAPETEKATATATTTSSKGHGKKPPSASEALSSAKIILDAATSKLHKAESESGGDHNVDKAKVAAAADVLAAAKHYGKLDENKNGKYLQKAEDYLYKYGEENRTSAGNSTVHNSMPHTASSHSASGHEANKMPHTASSHSVSGHEANKMPHTASYSASDNEENNYGKYLKKAEELLYKF